MIAAMLVACSGSGGKDPSPPATDDPTGIDDTGAEPEDTGAPYVPVECPLQPCVADLAIASADGPVNGWFGLGLAALRDGDDAWVVAGAPMVPGWSDFGQVTLLALPGLQPVETWVSDTAFDLTGNAVAIRSAVDVFPAYGGNFPEVAIGIRAAFEGVHHQGAAHVVRSTHSGDDPLQEVADLTILGTDDAFELPELGTSLAYLELTETRGAELVVAAPAWSATDRAGSAIYAFDPNLSGDFDDASARRSVTSSTTGLVHPVGWDSDGDGLDELACLGEDAGGMPQMLLFPSPWTGDIDRVDASVIWSSPVEEIIISLAVVSDVTGDGLDELAVGSTTFSAGAERSGALWIATAADMGGGSFTELPLRLEGTAAGQAVGGAVSGADLDGDGAGDLVAGGHAIVPSFDPGKLMVFPGPLPVAKLTPEDAAFTLYGEHYDDAFAIRIAAVDSDGGGTNDLVVAATTWNQQGRIYLLDGASLIP